MQIIIGSGGAIGQQLAKELVNYTSDIRLSSRNPKKISPTDELISLDVLDRDQVDRAIKGCEVCYMTVGFEYKTSVWQKVWPKAIENILSACQKYQTKLVFFDNIYMLDPKEITHITENSKVGPTSEKGKVRQKVNELIFQAVERGQIEAIVARSPDFFGVHGATSLMMIMLYENLKKGKKAQWLINADIPHSMGYVPDLAKATAMLGNSKKGWNEIWNLPTASPALSAREWTRYFVEEMKIPDKGIQPLPKWLISSLGLFIPIMKELKEMLYQYESPYFFDSSKIEREYGLLPTSSREAVKEVVSFLQKETLEK